MQTPKRIVLAITDGFPRAVRKGDFIKSTRSKYYVVSSRKVNTRDGSIKYALGVINVDEVPEEAFTWTMRWNKRTKKR